MKEIKTWRDPYDRGFSTCRARKIEIQPGITVLVGCNGSGKSTLIENIADVLRHDHIPTVHYNNLHDGGSNTVGNFYCDKEMSLMAAAWSSSEGEQISLNLAHLSSKLKNFIQTGEYYKNKISRSLNKLFTDDDKEKPVVPNERWILLDAVDSGFSIDNVIDLKNLLQLVIDDGTAAGMEMYIIIAANEYELVHEMNCMDATTGKYIRFAGYDDFKQFIINSRKKKDARYEREMARDQKN